MKRRFKIYFIGVAIGSLLAWALVIRQRNMRELMAWTPNGRILTEIQKDSMLVVPENLTCVLHCYGFDSMDWEALREEGNVDFQNSSTHTDPKRYIIRYKKESVELTVEVLFYKDRYVVDDIYSRDDLVTCDCP